MTDLIKNCEEGELVLITLQGGEVRMLYVGLPFGGAMMEVVVVDSGAHIGLPDTAVVERFT
jgi:hypothetical protein